MKRAYYQAPIVEFLHSDENGVLGELTRAHGHVLEHQQKYAWLWEIRHLHKALNRFEAGHMFVEFAIPRMGKRADVVLFLHGLLFVLEYKVGATGHECSAAEQVLDYALDLKNFHAGSHECRIVPIAIATDALETDASLQWYDDGVAAPIRVNAAGLVSLLSDILEQATTTSADVHEWLESPYKPTPTIVEASQALYQGHNVADISRSDAGAQNLTLTAHCIADVIERSKETGRKAICFVTGVPGSGKTLAGLNLANERRHAHQDENAVFLSGNGPLVDVLQEALARDEVMRIGTRKNEAMRKARALIQKIHHFRDDCLSSESPPDEKVVVFDEAQRAWSREQTSRFMREKKGIDGFDQSEPEFLLSAMDRHADWCVVVCLIGGGQEINTGEAGLTEWITALGQRFRHWQVYFSDQISGVEYTWGKDLFAELDDLNATSHSQLHLGVSVRSFRSEQLSAFVSAVIDSNPERAGEIMPELNRYPLFLTRDLNELRAGLRRRARGSERFGIVASSNAIRLKPDGLNVKVKIDPTKWFLNGKQDVRSSFYLEDVATEFDIQGLELDWVGVCWDANFRHTESGWSLHRFRGTKWENVNDEFKRTYLANAYRVLLTRARQGMIVYVPRGCHDDPTRLPDFYDDTYSFLRRCGIPELPRESPTTNGI